MKFVELTAAMKGTVFVNPANVAFIEEHPNMENGSLITFNSTYGFSPTGPMSPKEAPMRIGVAGKPAEVAAKLGDA